MEIQNSLEAEDREVFMTLSQTYLQWKEAQRQEGVQQGLEQGLEQGIERGLEQGLEQGLERGLERGLEQGLEQGKIEGKLESVPRLVALGLTLEQIASALELDLQQVRQVAGE
jgi:predicted transposase/invertase (TIGR01784 family)